MNKCSSCHNLNLIIIVYPIFCMPSTFRLLCLEHHGGPSAWKELSSWLSACAVLYLMSSLVFVFLSGLIPWAGCGIRLSWFYTIAFSSFCDFILTLCQSIHSLPVCNILYSFCYIYFIKLLYIFWFYSVIKRRVWFKIYELCLCLLLCVRF